MAAGVAQVAVADEQRLEDAVAADGPQIIGVQEGFGGAGGPRGGAGQDVDEDEVGLGSGHAP